MPGRYFEFIRDESAKFWEIVAHGSQVTVRFGRIGTAGQTQIKSFPDTVAANLHVEKLIGEKTRKGYAETVAR